MKRKKLETGRTETIKNKNNAYDKKSNAVRR